ncbi:MAG TPA: HEAT repeat domain-containing protein, partial [Candidatus Ozemobacteraceae bacterium]|nr:HEAT repeat domain-containing protein [Candidatus Ozemobacteraceae bacterium]
NLCRLLSDPDEWIVINVLEILSQLKESEAIPALVGQFEIAQDARLKAIIISSLSTFREPKLLHLFEEGLKSFDPRIQANAVEALANLKIPALELKRKLKKFLTHTNNRVRANAAIALSPIEPEAVKTEIEKMLNSSDVPTRRSAAYVLSKVQMADRDLMIDRLLADSSYMVRKIALKAALVMDTEIGTNRILPLLKDKNPWVRKEAVECGRKISRFPVDPVLELFKGENNPPVIESILDFVVDRRLNQAVALIVAKIKAQPEESLGRMIATLGRLQAREALFDVRKYLPPSDDTIMSRFYVALLLHGELNVFQELQQSLAGRPRDTDLLMLIKAAGEIG